MAQQLPARQLVGSMSGVLGLNLKRRIKMTGLLTRQVLATNSSTTSQAQDIPFGYTLVGVEVPVEITSTTFTIAQASSVNGVYLTLKDPLGTYGTAGNAITFTVGATSLGVFQIQPIVSALLYNNFKIILGSAETVALNLIFKQLM